MSALSGNITRTLVCGLLERDGKALFLLRTDEHGNDRLELPHVFSNSRSDPLNQIASAFTMQTSVKVHTGAMVFESQFNDGTDANPQLAPAYAFRMIAEDEKVVPATYFSGYKWLSLEDAKKKNLATTMEWIRKL